MAQPLPPVPRASVEAYRAAIAKAIAEGCDAETLTLRLTMRDESGLRRDRAVGVDEISFVGGEMRFHGVRVVSGGVQVSILDRGSADATS
jgi:hypothetical protein